MRKNVATGSMLGRLMRCMTVCWTGFPTGQLHKCGYKELFHRQLYQDLTSSELPEGVDIRMLLRPAVSNVICNNRPMNYLVAYNQMVSNRL